MKPNAANMSYRLIKRKSFSKMSIIDVDYYANSVTPIHMDQVSRISIVLQGQVKEYACKKEVFAQSGSIVLKPGDLSHQNIFSPKGSRIVSVVFGDDLIEDLFGHNQIDWQWFHGLPMATTAFQVAKELSTISTEEDLYEYTINLLAMLLPMTRGKENTPPPWLSLIKEKIQDEFKDSLRTKDLAAFADVHPVYLARIFRRHYGRSVKSYLQELRINNAIRDLSNMEKPLVDIALDAGFSDQSHLTRIFKNNLKMNPGAFRKWLTNFEIISDLN